MDKLPKLVLFGSTSLMGWLLPASMPMSTPIQGFSLASAFISSLVLVAESKKSEIQSRFAGAERSFEFERLATEMALSHQRELDQLHDRYYPDPDLEDDDDYAQPTLTGATLDQRTIAGGPGSGETDRLFRLEWLLQSNSQHALL